MAEGAVEHSTLPPHRPVVTVPLVGASKPQHLDEDVAAMAFRMNSDEISELEEPYVLYAVAGFA